MLHRAARSQWLAAESHDDGVGFGEVEQADRGLAGRLFYKVMQRGFIEVAPAREAEDALHLREGLRRRCVRQKLVLI